MCFHTPAHKQTNPAAKPAQTAHGAPRTVAAPSYEGALENARVLKGIERRRIEARDAFWARMDKWADGTIR
jgi:hypothetical protein